MIDKYIMQENLTEDTFSCRFSPWRYSELVTKEHKERNVMPGSHGGDQLDEDYSPDLYINHQFVGSDIKKVTVGKWQYKVGWAGVGKNQKMVAERWPRGTHFFEISEKTEVVPYEKIPKRVLKALPPPKD